MANPSPVDAVIPVAIPTIAATPAPVVQTTAAPVLWRGREIHKGKELTEVLTQIFGDLSKLPLLKWEWASSYRWNLKQIGWNEMSDSVMALQEKGKVIAVAVKYFDPTYQVNADKTAPALVIKVLSLAGRFNEQLQS